MKKKEELYARKKLGEHAASITDRMIEIRKLKGMTRKEFAEKCGVGIRTVCYWDSYQRAIKSRYLPAIFLALDVSPNEFFGVADKDPHAEWSKLQTDLLKVRSEASAILGARDIKLALPAIFRALDVSPNEFFGVADKDPHAEWNKLQTDLLKVRSEARAIVGAIDIKLACLKDGMREQAAK